MDDFPGAESLDFDDVSIVELAAACRELEAGVWVAREQRPWLDRLRDPLTKFGRVP